MARQLYDMQEWENLPSENTPVSAERMLHIEQGVRNNSENAALKEIYGDKNISYGSPSNWSKGKGSINFGSQNMASGNYSVAVGEDNTAYGKSSIAAGKNNETNGDIGIALGENNNVDGQCIALGQKNVAKKSGIAIGYNLTTSGYNQTLIGANNADDDNAAFIIGGGTPNDRKNIHSLDWQGNAMYTGTVESQGLILTDTATEQKYILTIVNGNIEITAIE